MSVPDLTPQEAAWIATAIKLPIGVRAIQIQVCAIYNKRLDDILSDNRRADLVEARSIAIFLVKMILNKSWKEIGRRFGGRDHATVIHAFRKIKCRAATDCAFAAEIAGLQTKIECTWHDHGATQ